MMCLMVLIVILYITLLVYQEELEEGASQDMGQDMGRSGSNSLLPDVTDMSRPLLADPKEKGIKRVGLIYSPRKSWWCGLVLVVLSIAIFVITILTAIL